MPKSNNKRKNGKRKQRNFTKPKTSIKPKEFEFRNFHYLILGTLIFIRLFVHRKISPDLIGGNGLHFWLVDVLPIIIGLFIFTIFTRVYKKVKNVDISIPDFTFPAILVSFLVMNTLSRSVWINFSQKGKEEQITCKIDRFRFSNDDLDESANYVYFQLNGNEEKIKNWDEEFIEVFRKENPKKFNLILDVKKGLWDYYILKDWEIVPSDFIQTYKEK